MATGLVEELLGSWNRLCDSTEPKIFRNVTTNTMRKRLPSLSSQCYFESQFNPAQAANKRQDVLVSAADCQVVQPFDTARFNFNQTPAIQTLCHIAPSFASATLQAVTPAPGAPNHAVLVNVSPVLFGHMLLVPHIDKCLPQVLTKEGVWLMCAFLRSAVRSDFRVLFNSLGAWATVNHLHLHGLYVDELEHKCFPVESYKRELVLSSPAPCTTTTTTSLALATTAISLSRLVNYATPCIVLECCANHTKTTTTSTTNDTEPVSSNSLTDIANGNTNNSNNGNNNNRAESSELRVIDRFAEVLFAAVQHLQLLNVPHNLLLAPGPVAYVFPRKPQVMHDGLGAAVCEISGLAVCRSDDLFQKLDFDSFEHHLRTQVAADEPITQSLIAHVISLL
eukprot:c1258_g1_i1.p1 GENE.c1258_g1_i1~~c1258_g1_i1.p1  ORF type:complete len:405 (+),score=96.37 c1258_g1_i1:35-1216(+)